MKPPVPDKTKWNDLLIIHSRLSQLPVQFRERVCEECAWSTPTFYRKMRLTDKSPENGKTLIAALSNAEKDKILSILFEVFGQAEEYLQRYGKKP